MLRTFFPIGQGNFAAEQFDDGINIVFDCGSSSGFANVKRQIEDAFQPNEEIKKVFVSHLDDDHVNGLKHLLSYCRVREVYLPYLTEESRIYTKFSIFWKAEKSYLPLLKNCYLIQRILCGNMAVKTILKLSWFIRMEMKTWKEVIKSIFRLDI